MSSSGTYIHRDESSFQTKPQLNVSLAKTSTVNDSKPSIKNQCHSPKLLRNVDTISCARRTYIWFLMCVYTNLIIIIMSQCKNLQLVIFALFCVRVCVRARVCMCLYAMFVFAFVFHVVCLYSQRGYPENKKL